jgi:glutamyl-tRNA reductase
MSLVVSYLDFRSAAVELRGLLAFSGEKAAEIVQALAAQPGVEGAVLLSTCNRTEVYLTGDCGTPWRLLCQVAGVEEEQFASAFVTLTGEDAARHLMEVACGLCSQILLEDQILSQVRHAMELSQQVGAADQELSTLFRIAVTVGKRAKTEIHLERKAPSMATRCVELLEAHFGELSNKQVLVIGNGQMGQLVAKQVEQAGAQVYMTLRSYRHGESVIPERCHPVPYEERWSRIPQMDGVISATTSPHYTVTAQQLAQCSRCPRVLIDLAVPRDMEPACGALPDVTLYDTDTLGASGPDNEAQLAEIHDLIEHHMAEFRRWKKRQTAPKAPYRFPLFIDLQGKRVVLVGGGTIAARRVNTLRLFGCQMVVISPELRFQAEDLEWIPRCYQRGDLEGADLVIAATDQRKVNHQVGEDARKLHIPVSVADREEECTFFFPAICAGDQVVAGVVSHGKDHHATARAAKAIRKVLEELP